MYDYTIVLMSLMKIELKYETKDYEKIDTETANLYSV
jgi:hypothetical protein